METLKNVLIVGGGGREDALGWKLSLSPHVKKIHFTPGNAGTEQIGINLDFDLHNFGELARFARDRGMFTVVGPEEPIAEDIAGVFLEYGAPIFAPSGEAARLEASKGWAIKFMERHHIPHPDSRMFTDVDDALRFLQNPPWEVVIKADGLYSGKGVKLPKTPREAKQTVIEMMRLNRYGRAGINIVIQERLKGKEVSVFALCDGETALPLMPVADYKRAQDHDRGLNTGGMGSYAPVPYVDAPTFDQICKTIILPTVRGMKNEGRPYKGMLYVGVMLTDQGPQVLEYNARFGDPETQTLMRLLVSDLGPLLLSCVEGTLSSQKAEFARDAAVCVVLCSQGYPQTYQKGAVIYGLDEIKDPSIKVFQAGTMMRGGRVTTNGGRVLGVTAKAKTLPEAVEKAYGVIGHPLQFPGMHYRRDIGLLNLIRHGQTDFKQGQTAV